MRREKTKKIKVGNIYIGGSSSVIIQSMTNTKTSDIKKTVAQIKRLESAGCELVRVSCLDMDDAKAIKNIKKEINIPIVADIHFNHTLALEAINSGVDKIRLNPGNLKNKLHIKKIVDACLEKNIPIRIGINSGSIPNGVKPTAINLVDAAEKEVKLLEEFGFTDIIISLKSTDVLTTIEAYRMASKRFPYPLHLGVTEAGTLIGGTVKSSLGIGTLLLEGIGDTIRISLTEDPVLEIRVAKEILSNLGLRNDVPNLISCPTCGRIEYDMEPIAKEVEKLLLKINKPITVAVMGCIVNGPGEAKQADLGIAGSKDKIVIFSKGKVIKTVKHNEALEELKKLIIEY